MKKILKASTLCAAIMVSSIMMLAGCGGGGKSLDNVLAPTDENALSVTPFQNEDPIDLVANSAADIGSFDADPVTTFSGGADIASAGGAWLDMATCNSCHTTTYNGFLNTNHNKAWNKKVATFTTYATATVPKKYCVQCHSVTGPFMDLDGDHIFDAADGEYGAFGLSPAVATSSANLVFGGTLGSASFTSVLDIDDEYKGIQCENCHGPASLHNGNKANIVSGYQAYGSKTCDNCHGQNEEWEKSAHSTSKAASHGSSSCTPCHNAEGFVEYAEYQRANLSMDIMEFIDSDYKTVNGGDAEGDGAHNINCAACHDPHEKYNEFQLRIAPEDLCISCHNSRKKIRGNSRRTPHHNLQGRVLNGQGLINPAGKMLWDVGGKYICDDSVEHSSLTDADCVGANYIETVATDIDPIMGDTTCVDCHMKDGIKNSDGSKILGHTFQPRTEACVDCHSGMDAASVIGVIQADFQKKYDKLAARLALATAAFDTSGNGTVTTADITTTVTAAKVTAYQNAEWNMFYLDYDGSKGMHNKDFTARAYTYTDQILTSLGY